MLKALVNVHLACKDIRNERRATTCWKCIFFVTVLLKGEKDPDGISD